MKKIPNLKYWADYYAQLYWNDTIDHPVRWTRRTKSYLGAVRWHKINGRKHLIDIYMNYEVLNFPDDNENSFHPILKHELCHYFLHKNGNDHKEYSRIFIEELKRVGGKLPKIYVNTVWSCSKCQKYIYTGKTINRAKFQNKKTCNCQCGAIGEHIWRDLTDSDIL